MTSQASILGPRSLEQKYSLTSLQWCALYCKEIEMHTIIQLVDLINVYLLYFGAQKVGYL